MRHRTRADRGEADLVTQFYHQGAAAHQARQRTRHTEETRKRQEAGGTCRREGLRSVAKGRRTLGALVFLVLRQKPLQRRSYCATRAAALLRRRKSHDPRVESRRFASRRPEFHSPSLNAFVKKPPSYMAYSIQGTITPGTNRRWIGRPCPNSSRARGRGHGEGERGGGGLGVGRGRSC